eukprot:1138506-Pelagomonas_calceolata.AAC.12
MMHGHATPAQNGLHLLYLTYCLSLKALPRPGKPCPVCIQILDFLLPEMENRRGRLVVVMAGYQKHMEEVLAYNEGLPSRFPVVLNFADYSDDQLTLMLERAIEGAYACLCTFSAICGDIPNLSVEVLRTKARPNFLEKLSRAAHNLLLINHVLYSQAPAMLGLKLMPRTPVASLSSALHAEEKPKFKLEDPKHARIAARRLGRQRGSVGFGNARAVRNLLEWAIKRQSARILHERQQGSDPDPLQLVRDDLLGPMFLDAGSSGALRKLEKMRGLQSVKESVSNLLRLIQTNAELEDAERPIKNICLNRVFLGSPGTGGGRNIVFCCNNAIFASSLDCKALPACLLLENAWTWGLSRLSAVHCSKIIAATWFIGKINSHTLQQLCSFPKWLSQS